MSQTKLHVQPKSIEMNPSVESLRTYTEQMDNCRITSFNNVNVHTRVDARSKKCTYIVTDHPDLHSDQTIPVEEGDRLARLQDAYLKDQDCVAVDGWIGNDPAFRTAARLIIEKSNSNIAGMQKTLYYPLTEEERKTFIPELTVIYTPNLEVPGYPENRVIAVNLDTNVTRVMNSDYFGESKKGGLRMWNKIVYDRGGLPMHAGCKVIPVQESERVMLIVGLSGTGKTTTTFTKQNNSSPVQDDFVALMPGGKVYATENGCFAKTFALDVESEPTIHRAVSQDASYLENVYQDDQGQVDFFNTSYTQNGRAVIRMQDISGSYDARKMDKAEVLLILNKNENCIPAVTRLNHVQAAAYFMLGETKGTSAGGKEEMGKSLRVPGTNPFFPLQHAQQGNRFLELLSDSPMEVYLLNTGSVGGEETDERSKKVRIHHSSAVVKAIAEGTIAWKRCPDFGYEIAESVPGIDTEDADLLQPRMLYEAQGRVTEYDAIVGKLKEERATYMQHYSSLDQRIVEAVK